MSSASTLNLLILCCVFILAACLFRQPLRRVLLAIAAGLAISAALLVAPGPLEGCYEFTGVSTSGTYFLRLRNGGVYFYTESNNDFSKEPAQYLGPYYQTPEKSWVLSESAGILRPHLLYLRVIGDRGTQNYPD